MCMGVIAFDKSRQVGGKLTENSIKSGRGYGVAIGTVVGVWWGGSAVATTVKQVED